MKLQHKDAGRVTDVLEGPVLKTLLVFAAPLFLANACQTAYNILDMAIVGHVVGHEALSGVSIGTDVMHFLLAVAQGMTGAGQIIIAREVGARDFPLVRKYVGTLLSFMQWIGLALLALALVGTPFALGWMNTPPEAYDSAFAYTLVCMLGVPFTCLFNAVASVLRAFGDSRTPMIWTFVASVVNIALDVLLVVCAGWGVAGAAAATVVAQGVSFAGAGAYFARHRASYAFELSRNALRVDGKCLASLVKLGAPMGLQHCSVMFSKVFCNAWVNGYGVTVSAAGSIGVRLNTLGQQFTMAIASAGGIMVARSLGAKDYERTKRVLGCSLGANLCWVGACILLMVAFPGFFFGIFTHEPDVLCMCMVYLPALVTDLACTGFRAGFVTLVNGSGRGVLNLLNALLDGIVGRIGLALLFGIVLEWGYFGFWMGSALAGLMPALVGLGFLLSGKWRK